MRKTKLLCLLMLMLAAVLCNAAWAEDAVPTMAVSSAEGRPGAEVQVTVSLQNNPGVVAAELKLAWDTDKLELTKAESGTLMTDSVFSDKLTINPYYMAWDEAWRRTDMTNSGTLATLTFKIKEGCAVGDVAAISLTSVKAHNTDLNRVTFTATSGSITVVAADGGDSGDGGAGSGGNTGGGGGGGGTVVNTVDVTFRLIGCTPTTDGSSVDFSEGVPAGLHGAEYQTWIKTTKYTLNKGATVKDLFELALQNNGLSWSGKSNWVSMITAPGALGGYELSEQDNGNYSGWMYTVNGKHQNSSFDEYVLKNGDKVIWHYINDYQYEQEDWAGGSLYGNKDTFNLWLKAADVNPSGAGSAGGGTSGGGKNSAVSVEYKPVVQVDANGEAKVNLPAETAKVVVSEAVDVGAGEIIIEPKLSNTADKITVTMPASSALQMGKKAGAFLTVKTELAIIKIGKADLLALDGVSGIFKVSVARGADGAVVVSITVADKDISLTDSTITLPTANAAQGDVLMCAADDDWQVITHCASCELGVVGRLAGSGTFKLADRAVNFGDVTEHWGQAAAEFVAARDIFNGTAAGVFAPNEKMNRAMVATVLWRLQGAPQAAGAAKFADVIPDWAQSGVNWAAAQGIVTGYEDGTFRAEALVTRQELAAMLYRFAKVAGLDTSPSAVLSGFADGEQVSDWAVDAMKWMVGAGLLQGDETKAIHPMGTATRAEVATVVMRLIENSVK